MKTSSRWASFSATSTWRSTAIVPIVGWIRRLLRGSRGRPRAPPRSPRTRRCARAARRRSRAPRRRRGRARARCGGGRRARGRACRGSRPGRRRARPDVAEPALRERAARALHAAEIAEQRDRQLVLRERVADVGDYDRRRLDGVEHAHQRRADVAAAVGARRRRVAGEQEEVVAFVDRQPQAARERAQQLLGGLRPALLLQPREVVGRHAGQRRDLLAPQARRAAARPGAEADVLGPQRLAAAAQEVGELSAVHHSSMPAPTRAARERRSLDARAPPHRRADAPSSAP